MDTNDCNIFQTGNFTLASGEVSDFKIECDWLRDEDFYTFARQAVKILPPFGEVFGVPRGGLRFADALKRYATPDCKRVLIADDVLTSGGSIQRISKAFKNPLGIVIFARGPLPDWVKAIFVMTRPE